ncbi:vitamin K epoxide reductase family protein [Gaiella sp.]|uniref:vitamin K epoxide reductase family protein n=1 Tax=Gaiella sp. TaxID=2663207 RepID=UPI002E3725CB|nr:vitamin K epoxide reductase family protein [Gaiella sp.]HEX5584420.1 vitamin K epoxide reductase family protein [Gaiella sp.]
MEERALVGGGLGTDRLLRAAVAVVALVGIGIAGYLTYVHYQPDALICTASGGCEQVQDSDYATLFGLPVALLGLCAYVVVLALVVWDTEPARIAAAAIALGAAGFAVYLVSLQAFVIDAWCVWCLANDIVVVPLLTVLTIWRALRVPDG